MFALSASAATYKYNNQNLEVQTEGDWQYIVLTEAALTAADKEMGIKAGDAYITKYSGTVASISIPATLGGKTVATVGTVAFKDNKAIQTVTIGASVKFVDYDAFVNCTGLQTVLIAKNVKRISTYVFNGCTAMKTVTFQNGIQLESMAEACFINCTSLNNFTIPDTVKTIGNYAFWNCDSMTEIAIPDSVTSLGAGAFFHCNSLINAVIGNGVTSLATSDKQNSSSSNFGTDFSYCEGAFEGCISLQSVKIGTSVTSIGQDCFAGTDLLEVNIPKNVTSIALGAFMNCKSMKKVVIGNGVKTVGERAFENCDSLTDVKIGSGVASLGAQVFWDCDALKTISIPSNVTSLGAGAFYHCDSLEEVFTGNGITALSTSQRQTQSNNNWGSDYYYREGTFEGCLKLKNIVLGNGIVTIGQDCFAGTALTEVTIPDNVITVSAGAFMNCDVLEKIVIGDGVTSLGDHVFEDSDKLTDVQIGSGVVTIGTYAFWDCDGLVNIFIPSNVTKLGAGAFFHCSNLETAVIGNGITALSTSQRQTKSNNNWGSDYYYREGVFEGCVKLSSITLGSGIISIGQDTFAGTQITTLTVPAKVSSLGEGAFAGATKLKDIYFTGNWASSVGGRLFENIAAGYTLHYLKNKTGYDELTYNKAVFTPVVVTFDNNDDDVFAAPTEEQVMSPVGGFVIEPIDPAAYGYRFMGWYKDSKCTQKWNFETDKVTKNTTIYASWKPVSDVVPQRPGEVNAEAVTGKSIDLLWTAVDGALSYNVYVNGEKVNTAAIADNKYTVIGLQGSSTYEIEVTAVNAKGESARSLIIVVKTAEIKLSLGDIDDDGTISAADARLVLRMSVNLEIPSADQEAAADIDGDGNISAADARLVLRISVNLDKIENYIK